MLADGTTDIGAECLAHAFAKSGNLPANSKFNGMYSVKTYRRNLKMPESIRNMIAPPQHCSHAYGMMNLQPPGRQCRQQHRGGRKQYPVPGTGGQKRVEAVVMICLPCLAGVIERCRLSVRRSECSLEQARASLVRWGAKSRHQ